MKDTKHLILFHYISFHFLIFQEISPLTMLVAERGLAEYLGAGGVDLAMSGYCCLLWARDELWPKRHS